MHDPDLCCLVNPETECDACKSSICQECLSGDVAIGGSHPDKAYYSSGRHITIKAVQWHACDRDCWWDCWHDLVESQHTEQMYAGI